MDILDTVISNIRNELKLQNISQSIFAEKMGVGAVHMSNMMRGQKKGSMDTFSFLSRAAEVLGVPITKLLPLDESASQYVYLINHKGELSEVAFKRSWLEQFVFAEQFNSENFFVEHMPDESMLPTIKVNDLLLIAKKTSIVRDGIYMFKQKENAIIRRVSVQLNNQFMVHSDSNLIPPVIMYKNEFSATLLGQIVWLGRNL